MPEPEFYSRFLEENSQMPEYLPARYFDQFRETIRVFHIKQITKLPKGARVKIEVLASK